MQYLTTMGKKFLFTLLAFQNPNKGSKDKIRMYNIQSNFSPHTCKNLPYTLYNIMKDMYEFTLPPHCGEKIVAQTLKMPEISQKW
jgi:hypothetical protein